LVEQDVKRARKKKGDGDEKLAFEIGEVFTPEKAKKEDFELDQESATYRARKGESGDRRQT
jgi:hypothetical protein